MVNKRAIYQTLLYSDLFHYPLTASELWMYLIADKPVAKEEVFAYMQKKHSFFDNKNGYYFLPRKKSYILLRKKREKISSKKIQKAKSIAEWIGYLPTVRLIGLSGSVAMKNAERSADIDFFIICQSGTVWLTRFLVVGLLSLFGLVRKRGDKGVKDKVCTNMFVDESALCLPKERQNLFTAHEIIQMKPLVTKKNTYRMFLGANSWIKQFLPNSLGNFPLLPQQGGESPFLFIFEKIAKIVQSCYMQKYKTSEVTTDTLLAFHPVDMSKIILTKYQQKLDKKKQKNAAIAS